MVKVSSLEVPGPADPHDLDLSTEGDVAEGRIRDASFNGSDFGWYQPCACWSGVAPHTGASVLRRVLSEQRESFGYFEDGLSTLD
jgi:hypothetical protein